MEYVISRTVGSCAPDFIIVCTDKQTAEKKLSETVAAELATMRPLYPAASFVSIRRVNAAVVRFENYPIPITVTMLPMY